MPKWFVYFLIFLVVLFFIWLMLWIIKWQNSRAKPSTQQKLVKRTRENAAAQGLLITCPLCNTPLPKGVDLYSRVYRPMNVPHQLCIVMGCPHCYPKIEPGVRRECPVCHKPVPQDGHLVARLFNYADGKKHVAVTGCTNCCKSSD